LNEASCYIFERATLNSILVFIDQTAWLVYTCMYHRMKRAI